MSWRMLIDPEDRSGWRELGVAASELAEALRRLEARRRHQLAVQLRALAKILEQAE